jgi:hypothetical protein
MVSLYACTHQENAKAAAALRVRIDVVAAVGRDKTAAQIASLKSDAAAVTESLRGRLRDAVKTLAHSHSSMQMMVPPQS